MPSLVGPRQPPLLSPQSPAPYCLTNTPVTDTTDGSLASSSSEMVTARHSLVLDKGLKYCAHSLQGPRSVLLRAPHFYGEQCTFISQEGQSKFILFFAFKNDSILHPVI